MYDITFKLVTVLDEKKASFPLFERCYELEREETPDEARNDVSSHNDRILMEMIRLGGCDGNPRGLYPAVAVASVWDKLSRTFKKQSESKIDAKQYESDMNELKERVKKYGGHSFSHLYLDNSIKFNYMNVFLLDPIAEQGYEIEGIGIHRASEEILVNIISSDFSKTHTLRKNLEELMRGQYLKDQNITELTSGIKTKVIYLESIMGREYTEYQQRTCETNPFSNGGFRFSLEGRVGSSEVVSKTDKKGRDCGEWAMCHDLVREDLDENQLTIADSLAKQFVEGSREELKRIEKLARLQRKLGYIFLSHNGEVIY